MKAMKATVLAAAAASLLLPACSSAPPAPSPSASTGSASTSPATTWGPIAEEAPEDCGFDEGTELIFAGRATTAALQVQEVIGDPMSNDPADIYITFEEFDYGAVRGRRVCAVYVEPAGFVEVTLAPEGWSPETGRPPATPTPTPTERASEAPALVASAEEAVDIARAAAPEAATWDVVAVHSTRLGEYDMFAEQYDWSRDLPLDLRIWTVSLGEHGSGILVIVNAETGEVLLVSHWIA